MEAAHTAAFPQTLAEIKKRIAELPEQARKDVAYLEHLAHSTSTDIANWNIMSMLSGIPQGDKRAINRQFFLTREATHYKLSEATIEAINKATADSTKILKESFADEIRRAHEQARIHLDHSNSYFRSAYEKLASARMQRDRAASLQAKDPQEGLVDEIKAIVEAGFWEFMEARGVEFKFKTRAGIVLRAHNPAAKIDYQVSMGKYYCKLNIQNANLTVYPLENNIDFNGYFHPYVSSSSAICWGNATDQAISLLDKRKYAEALALLASLLSSYSDTTTPYVRLYEFNEVANGRRPEELDLCSDCERPFDECVCNSCVECGRHLDDCECFYCERCEASTGMARCDRHWCPACETYDAQTCDCCEGCSETDDNCDRCRECDRHDGHDRGCSNAPGDDGEARI
jgi:hypothetical protein